MEQSEQLIKSKTNCPTCGAECKIGTGDGNSHYYIPKTRDEFSDKELLAWEKVDVIFKKQAQKQMFVWNHKEFRHITHPRLYKAIIETAILFSRDSVEKAEIQRKRAGILVDGKFYTEIEFGSLKTTPEGAEVVNVYY